MTKATAKKKWNTVWKAMQDFFPGLFDNEALIAAGHGLARGSRASAKGLAKGIDYLSHNAWIARWSLILFSGALMWAIYCAPDIGIHELAARHPSEIHELRLTVTKFGENDVNLNGDWEEHYALWSTQSPNGKKAMALLEDLHFRRYIGEPLARLLPDQDGVGTAELNFDEYVLRAEFLDETEHAYFTLLIYPNACYYAKDGWGTGNKSLAVVLKNEDARQSLYQPLYSLCR